MRGRSRPAKAGRTVSGIIGRCLRWRNRNAREIRGDLGGGIDYIMCGARDSPLRLKLSKSTFFHLAPIKPVYSIYTGVLASPRSWSSGILPI